MTKLTRKAGGYRYAAALLIGSLIFSFSEAATKKSQCEAAFISLSKSAPSEGGTRSIAIEEEISAGFPSITAPGFAGTVLVAEGPARTIVFAKDVAMVPSPPVTTFRAYIAVRNYVDAYRVFSALYSKYRETLGNQLEPIALEGKESNYELMPDEVPGENARFLNLSTGGLEANLLQRRELRSGHLSSAIRSSATDMILEIYWHSGRNEDFHIPGLLRMLNRHFSLESRSHPE